MERKKEKKEWLHVTTTPKLTFLIAAGILFHKNLAFALTKHQQTSIQY